MSTHTVFTFGASMLATASECWIVVSSKRISGEETIYISRFDKAHQVFASGCADDCRSRHDRDFAFSCPRPAQLPTQFANDRRLRFVGIDDRVDELKQVSVPRRTLH